MNNRAKYYLLSLVFGAGFFLVQPSLEAESSNPKQINLSGPEVAKLDWNTRALTMVDLNGDGRLDLALINNDRAKIEMLFQRDPDAPPEEGPRQVSSNRWEPVLEDSRFRRESIVSGDNLYALAGGDLNNDGRADLAYTGNKQALTVRFQGDKSQWSETWTFDDMDPAQWASTLQIVDLNGDGRNDLIVLCKEKLLIFYQRETGELSEPKSYPVADDNNFGLELFDLNKDGFVDIFYAVAKNKRALRLRLQFAEGGFGPELTVPLESATSSIRPWILESDGSAGLAYIQSKTRHLEILSLSPQTMKNLPIKALQPATYSSGTTARDPALYTMGDFNGDGLTDLALGDSQGARVLLFWQKESSIFSEPTPYPSLANLYGISAGDFTGDGRSTLVGLSKKEGILGLSRFSPKGRLEFPEMIPTEGEPLALTVGDIDLNGRDEILLIEKIEKKYQISILRPDNDHDQDTITAEPFIFEDLKRDPEALLIADLNGDELPDILVFIPREPARLLVQTDTDTFENAADDSAIRKSLLTNLDFSQIGLGDLDGDGIPELIAGSDGFARSLRLNAEGDLEITDQYNARRSEDKVRGPLVLDMNQDGVSELLFYDDKEESIQMLERDASGVYRFLKSYEVGKIDLLSARVSRLGRDSREHILLFGKDRFWVIPLDNPGWETTTVATYETDLKDIRYTGLATGDLDSDGSLEIIAIDAQKHVIEILRQKEPNIWSSALHYTVYDDNPHYQGRRGANLEPREIVVGDLSGDGRDDFALLIHDRVLLYIQE